MLRSLLSWVTVSPKVPADLVAVNYPSVNAIDEARWLVKAGDPLPPRLKNARHHVLSPLFDGAIPNAANINHAVALAKENPDWRVSCQMHKLLGLR
jgi:organic radical activating enzyme